MGIAASEEAAVALDAELRRERADLRKERPVSAQDQLCAGGALTARVGERRDGAIGLLPVDHRSHVDRDLIPVGEVEFLPRPLRTSGDAGSKPPGSMPLGTMQTRSGVSPRSRMSICRADSSRVVTFRPQTLSVRRTNPRSKIEPCDVSVSRWSVETSGARPLRAPTIEGHLLWEWITSGPNDSRKSFIARR
jgi:hypothetical protein